MNFGPLRLGSRTLKTALSVMLCILIFEILDRDAPMIACLAAIFALRQDLPSTINYGTYRIVGNTFGGLVAIFYFYVYRWLGHNFIVELILIPLLVIFIIMIADAANLNVGIIGACATFFIIVLAVPADQTFWYAINRVFDTILGTVIALGVNFFVNKPDPPVALSEAQLKAEINARQSEIEELEAALKTLYKKS